MSRNVLAFAVAWLVLRSVALAGPDQWIEVSSSHFSVLTNSNEKQARHFVDQFERMRWVFQTLFPTANTDPPAPIEVYAAKNGKSFQAVEPQAYLAKGQLSLAGYFLTTQDQNFILMRMDAEQEHPFSTVYHEYTHLQFRSAGDWMPLWLNEGMAEFFQNTEFRDKDVLLGEPSPDDILYLRQERLIPLPVLFKVDASSPYYHQEQKGSVFYAEAWALTHYLIVTDREHKTNTFTEYMNRVRKHEDPVTAAQEAFGDLKQLEQALANYVRGAQYKQFIIPSAAAPIDESKYAVHPATQTEADLMRADVLSLVQRQKEAEETVNAILSADQNNAQAHEVKGRIAFRAGNMEEARTEFGEAVKLDSKSYLANYYFGAIALQSQGSVSDTQIESSLRTAIQLNAKFAPAYDKLASLYAMRKERLNEAYTLITSAVKLDPGNLYFRIDAANVAEVMDRSDEALKILETSSKLARNQVELGMVQNRIQQINEYRQAKAESEKQRHEVEAEQAHVDSSQTVRVVEAANSPKYPEEANGPKHSVVGVMHGVICSYPSVIVFRVDGVKGSVRVYSNNFAKIDLTASGLTPKDTMFPCSDFEGMTAKVQYAETTDKTVDGQVFAIELRKSAGK